MRRDELTMPDPAPNDRPGDRWMCGRAGSDSACSRGPGNTGTCPLADACRPRRTWHGRRKLISLLAALLMVGIVVGVTWRVDSASLLKPGDLSSPHAQILAATLTPDRCASCHPQAATSPWRWFSRGVDGHQGVSQTDRCLNCHHPTIDRGTASLAHNLPLTTRARLRSTAASGDDPTWHDWMPGPAVDPENVQCSACHREHRGADGDLLAVSDSQCQTCHSDRFGSFATSHPEWIQWPYGRGRVIAFDHLTHARKHYPAQTKENGLVQFQCADCHQQTDQGELTRVLDYRRACMSCHDESLRIETADGIELLALPSLTRPSAERVGQWPDMATGFYDGRLTPIAELLTRSDPQTASAVRLIPGRDFGRIVSSDADAVNAAEIVAVAHRRLLGEIARGGQGVILDRFARLGVTRSTAAPLLQSLPTQLIESAYLAWFPVDSGPPIQQTQFHGIGEPPASLLVDPQSIPADPNADAGGAENLLFDAGDEELQLLPLDDSLAVDGSDQTDPLTTDPLTIQPEQPVGPSNAGVGRFDPQQMMPLGGWFRDDLRLAIRYRAGGHADAVLKSTIELASQLPAGDPSRKSLLQSPAIAACLRCHPGAASSGRWQSRATVGDPSQLTKFVHGPHLNIAQLADCSHCHRVASQASNPVELTGLSSQHHDFAPLTRQACAVCHTPQAAGDSCTTCHRYHSRKASVSP